jgi:hypothetical protein
MRAMTKPYYNALDALCMLERHGMTFEDRFHDERGKIIECRLCASSDIRLYAPSNQSDRLRFYPDAAGLALLEPRVGDYVGFLDTRYGTGDKYCGGEIRKLWTEGFARRKITLDGEYFFKYEDIKFLIRNSIPLIMPQREE